MQVVYMVFAVFLLIAGHAVKSLRWKQLLSVYEDVEVIDLLSAMTVGQTINMIIPFRVGDLFRIWRIGAQKLKNGYILSMATVLIDVFIDTVTVGLAFVALYLLDLHKSAVKDMAVGYGVLSLAVVIVCIMVFIFKRWAKLIVQRFAKIFNARIEQNILMEVYVVFASLKDMLKVKNAFRLLAYTVGVWICYFSSYGLFADFLQRIGHGFTFTGVFRTIFSMSGNALFWECLKAGQDAVLVWFAVYLFTPLGIITVFLIINNSLRHSVSKSHKTRLIVPHMNETERLAFLNIYFNDVENRDFFDAYLRINENVSVLRDCSAGSNATTILAMDAENTFYRKYAIGAEAEKLRGQIEWLSRHKEDLPLCNIIRTCMKGDVCYYDMEYLSSAVGMFEYIHRAPVEKSWGILESVLEVLDEKLYSQTHRAVEPDAIKKYIAQKILKNIQKCEQWCRRYFKELFDGEYVFINGKQYQNLNYYKKYFNTEFLFEIFREDWESDIHGDLTIENIIYVQEEHKAWYLIDPNQGNMLKSPFLDYAKLLQSLHGKYEFFMMVNNVQVVGNHIDYFFTESTAYEEIYVRYRQYLQKHFTVKQIKSIYCHETVHWLRLMPYKIQKNPQSAIVFYAGMLIVLSDIEDLFK